MAGNSIPNSDIADEQLSASFSTGKQFLPELLKLEGDRQVCTDGRAENLPAVGGHTRRHVHGKHWCIRLVYSIDEIGIPSQNFP